MTKAYMKFQDAITEKKIELEKLKEDLGNLEFLAKRVKNLDVLWKAEVNFKNAERSKEVCLILSAFKKRCKTVGRFTSVADVTASTDRLWRMVHYNHSGSSSSKFRSHLNWMKMNNILIFISDKNEWKLTDKGVSYLCDE